MQVRHTEIQNRRFLYNFRTPLVSAIKWSIDTVSACLHADEGTRSQPTLRTYREICRKRWTQNNNSAAVPKWVLVALTNQRKMCLKPVKDHQQPCMTHQKNIPANSKIVKSEIFQPRVKSSSQEWNIPAKCTSWSEPVFTKVGKLCKTYWVFLVPN